jgi:hypothetical protein
MQDNADIRDQNYQLMEKQKKAIEPKKEEIKEAMPMGPP